MSESDQQSVSWSKKRKLDSPDIPPQTKRRRTEDNIFSSVGTMFSSFFRKVSDLFGGDATEEEDRMDISDSISPSPPSSPSVEESYEFLEEEERNDHPNLTSPNESLQSPESSFFLHRAPIHFSPSKPDTASFFDTGSSLFVPAPQSIRDVFVPPTPTTPLQLSPYLNDLEPDDEPMFGNLFEPVVVEDYDYRAARNQVMKARTEDLSILPQLSPSVLNDDLARLRWVRQQELLQEKRTYALLPTADVAHISLRTLSEQQLRRNQRELDRIKRRAEEESQALIAKEAEEKARRRKLRLEQATEYTLTPEEDALVRRSLAGNPEDVVSNAFNIMLTREHLQRLSPREWLSDDVINFYLNMIVERNKSRPDLPRVHTFNTFFYTTLNGRKGYDYPRVRRWTKSVDIFSFEFVLVPIHLGLHWCMAVINMKEHRIEYYDSLGGRNPECIAILRKYLVDESRDKKNVDLDLSSWEDHAPGLKVPQQQNGYDCGVFAIRFAEKIALGFPFNFSQEHIPQFRKRMILEILDCKLKEVDLD